MRASEHGQTLGVKGRVGVEGQLYGPLGKQNGTLNSKDVNMKRLFIVVSFTVLFKPEGNTSTTKPL